MSEQLRNDQERMYAEAKLQMDREILLNTLLRRSGCNNADSTTSNSSSNLNQSSTAAGTHNLPWSHKLNTTPLRRNDGETLSDLERQINLRAAALAKSYLASLDSAKKQDEKLSYQKVFLAYKFNETPSHVIVKGMLMMGDLEQSRGYFKKLAKLVHPDKNSHPLSNEVFQKLSNATQLAMKQF